MKLPFVSRKKYETLKKNLKLKNEHNQSLEKKSRKFQEKNIELEERIKELQKALNANNLTAYLRRCTKCNKYFTVPKNSRRKICLDCKNEKTTKREEKK